MHESPKRKLAKIPKQTLLHLNYVYRVYMSDFSWMVYQIS